MSSATYRDIVAGNAGYFVRSNPTLCFGGVILLLVIASAVFAEALVGVDPLEINPLNRMKPPSAEHWFGTDMFGRDILSRTLHGGRISLLVGLVVSACATASGLTLGLLAGYNRIADALVMRVMDGLMSIPAILLAIALTAVTNASTGTVIFAITVVELPRVVRLVRSVVLSVREQAYVEAAVIAGTRPLKIVVKHILPNTIAPLTVQATYICAAAILIESLLSFLGAGTPPEIPSWGNIMAESRIYFQLAPWMILIPGVFLAVTVLAVNLMGDGLRDLLDPRLSGTR
ncbi:ABC transporter permease [Thalassobaculum sp.]|uniref:ABC transporter permease n=1 Tax=Thalassobaculum sp. TaxID=2022740 RepID=UPI0032EB0016